MAKKKAVKRVRPLSPHQKEVAKLKGEIASLTSVNNELRYSDSRNSLIKKEDQYRILNDKFMAKVEELQRMIRMVDQFTSINISSPTPESRSLRNTNNLK